MAMTQSSSAIASKWAKNLAAATSSITAGVNSVTSSPTHKAAARAQAYADGVQRAVSSGKYAKKLMAVSLSDWQQAMIQKGVPRIAQGANAAVPKFDSFMSKFAPHLAALQSKLAAVPRGDINQNIERARIAILHNAEFKM